MNKELLNKNASKIVGALIMVVFASAIYLAGFNTGVAQTKNIEIKGIKGGENPTSVDEDFTTFWEAWSELKSKHINGEKINERKLLEGAIQGLAGSFDDPYTTYFNPEDSIKFNEDVRGQFGGIGAEIGIKEDQLIIVAPLKDSPAERAGLKANDKIAEIDGKTTYNITVEGAVKLIRGNPGEKIVLTIFRNGFTKTQKIEITREIIQIPTIKETLDENNILHIELYSFNEISEKLFREAVANPANKNAKGLILDLRNNPGGYLDVAVSMSGWFLDRGSIVVREKYSSGEETVLRANGNGILKEFPKVILINGGSASASEILAGALRDNLGTKLIGEKTFGKGTVQQIDTLKDGSSLKITIANWLTPKGTVIDKNGIEPDIKIELTEKDIESKTDSQLEKAKEVLSEIISNN